MSNNSTVLLLYSGGTIGMKRSGTGALSPASNQMFEELKRNTILHDAQFAQRIRIKMNQLVLPAVDNSENRIVYNFVEYEPLLDSSNMGQNDWIRLAKDIEKNYNDYNGFVIMHGTDTLAYTASALSFMLDHLKKPVILVGSMMPIFETRTDGRDNLFLAIYIAGTYLIPEVCILSRFKLFRGNRTIEINCDSFESFGSPNYQPLAEFNAKISTINWDMLIKPCKRQELKVGCVLNPNIAMLKLYPDISIGLVKAILAEPTEGVVLISYGKGNVPSKRQDLLHALSEAIKRGVIIINCTQCLRGTVADDYETGAVLNQIGVLPGFDMTSIAAYTKLAYLLGNKSLTLDERKRVG